MNRVNVEVEAEQKSTKNGVKSGVTFRHCNYVSDPECNKIMAIVITFFLSVYITILREQWA